MEVFIVIDTREKRVCDSIAFTSSVVNACDVPHFAVQLFQVVTTTSTTTCMTIVIRVMDKLVNLYRMLHPGIFLFRASYSNTAFLSAFSLSFRCIDDPSSNPAMILTTHFLYYNPRSFRSNIRRNRKLT